MNDVPETKDVLAGVLAALREIAARLDHLEAAAASAPASPLPDVYVTLDQAAAMVHRSKRTLEHYRRRMPAPASRGRRGQPHLWRWCEVRPWLEAEFGQLLPECFPGLAY